MARRSGGAAARATMTLAKRPDFRAFEHMTLPKEPTLIQLPITYDAIVAEIVQHTGLPSEEVAHRVWMEALETGWNVMRDVQRFGVTPFTFNQEMIRLYT